MYPFVTKLNTSMAECLVNDEETLKAAMLALVDIVLEAVDEEPESYALTETYRGSI